MAELYESRHTGAEIDDAVDRAKVGGEIDAILNAAEYSATATYALGDYCKHNGKLYRCTTAITEAEAWTDAHWTDTSVTAELIAIYTALQKKVNPNLLDNWYFGNPINQRGFTSAKGQTVYYTLDRWFIGDIWTSGACEARYYDGESLAFKEGLFQRFEVNKSVFANKTLTASALTTEGKLDARTITLPANIVNGTSYTFTNKGIAIFLNDVIRWNSDNIAEFRFESANAVSLVAAKLELGDTQTLAHQDDNGVWVLNEIPDYGEQLARCQRHFQLYSSADLRPAKAVDCRPTMRADPSQSTIVVNSTTYYYNTADL